MTNAFTQEFGQEFEVERARWLRRRVLWYCGVLVVAFALQMLWFPLTIWWRMARGDADGGTSASILATLGGGVVAATLVTKGIQIAVLAFTWHLVRRRGYRQDDLLGIVSRLILVLGAIRLASEVAMLYLLPDTFTVNGEPLSKNGMLSVGTVMSALLTVHFVACLFIPWTPRESLRPMVPLLAIAAGIVLGLSDAPLAVRGAALLLLPLVIVPGAVVAWYRHSRFSQQFKFRMLTGRYGEMKQQLSDARRIHDVLFPGPIRSGPILFDYRYEPMRQIGGDYLYVHRPRPPERTSAFTATRSFSTGGGVDGTRATILAPLPVEGPMSVVLLDVTGHGIGAALTVNRIHGELERLFGEDPDRTPGETLCALNHYINVALARHSVFATALCIRIDPDTDRLVWASGGHPPAFITSPGGYVDRLDPTTFILGVCPDKAFEPGEQERRFEPGDVIVAYTDGVTEARNFEGRMLRTDGMQWIMSSLAESNRPRRCGDHVGSFAEGVLTAVREYRAGGPQDDTLIVEISRAIDDVPAATRAAAAGISAFLPGRERLEVSGAGPRRLSPGGGGRSTAAGGVADAAQTKVGVAASPGNGQGAGGPTGP